MGPMRRVSVELAFCLLFLACVAGHEGHEEGDGNETPACSAAANPLRLTAPYAPGTITLDGDANDWDSLKGLESVPLQQAVAGSGAPMSYPQGKGTMTMKAAHDGHSLFLLLKVPGAYVFNPTNPHLSISAALMFGIGDDATLYNMGGCPQAPGACTAESCRNHEVDLVHWEISTAIPGRQYGRNLADLFAGTGRDSIGKLNDGYGYNPHCRFADKFVGGTGLSSNGSAENDWVGVWSHTAVSTTYGLVGSDSPFGTAGDAGSFVFEFSRLLRTGDHFQQDAQFSIGREHRFGVAVWYPVEGLPWRGEQHYTLSCDWALMALAPAPTPIYGWSYAASSQSIPTTAATSLSALAMVLSLAAVFISIVVGWWVRQHFRQFSNLDGL